MRILAAIDVTVPAVVISVIAQYLLIMAVIVVYLALMRVVVIVLLHVVVLVLLRVIMITVRFLPLIPMVMGLKHSAFAKGQDMGAGLFHQGNMARASCQRI